MIVRSPPTRGSSVILWLVMCQPALVWRPEQLSTDRLLTAVFERSAILRKSKCLH